MRKKQIKIIMIVAIILIFVLPACIKLCLFSSVKGHIYSDVNDVPECRVALVLGAGIGPNGRLSKSLETRVKTAIKLYKAGKVDKLLMSGDNRVSHYNEPQRMCDYAVRRVYLLKIL